MLVIIQTFEFLRLCLEKTPPPPKPLDVSFPPGAVTQKWLPDALRIRVLDPAKVRVGRPITKMHGFPTEVVECWRKGRWTRRRVSNMKSRIIYPIFTLKRCLALMGWDGVCDPSLTFWGVHKYLQWSRVEWTAPSSPMWHVAFELATDHYEMMSLPFQMFGHVVTNPKNAVNCGWKKVHISNSCNQVVYAPIVGWLGWPGRGQWGQLLLAQGPLGRSRQSAGAGACERCWAKELFLVAWMTRVVCPVVR